METENGLQKRNPSDTGKAGMKRNRSMERYDTAKRKKAIAQFIKFGLVGVGNTAVSLAVYYIVLWLDPNMYLFGSILGAALSIFHAFLWSNYYVFPQKGQTPYEFFMSLGKCYASYGSTSILSNVMLWFEVSQWHINKLYAPVINLMITIPLNFVLNKLWVFGHKKEDEYREK